MRQPPGGVADVGISADTMFVARVPIYDTCDAGRGFWKKLRHDILSTVLKENAVIRALHIHQEDGEPKSMLATHVDDMLWATKPGYEDRVQQLLDRYTMKTVESGTYTVIFWSQSDARTRQRRLSLCVTTLRGVCVELPPPINCCKKLRRWSVLQKRTFTWN